MVQDLYTNFSKSIKVQVAFKSINYFDIIKFVVRGIGCLQPSVHN